MLKTSRQILFTVNVRVEKWILKLEREIGSNCKHGIAKRGFSAQRAGWKPEDGKLLRGNFKGEGDPG